LFAGQLRDGGRRRVEYCVEGVEEMQKEKGEFGAAVQPLLFINCYMRNQSLGVLHQAISLSNRKNTDTFCSRSQTFSLNLMRKLCSIYEI
jgi:hypothetical protein